MHLVADKSQTCPKCEGSGITNNLGGCPDPGQFLKWCSLCFGQCIVPDMEAARYMSGLYLWEIRMGHNISLAIAAGICCMSEFNYARLEQGYPLDKVTPKVGWQMIDLEMKQREENTER